MFIFSWRAWTLKPGFWSAFGLLISHAWPQRGWVNVQWQTRHDLGECEWFFSHETVYLQCVDFFSAKFVGGLYLCSRTHFGRYENAYIHTFIFKESSYLHYWPCNSIFQLLFQSGMLDHFHRQYFKTCLLKLCYLEIDFVCLV